MPSITAIVPAKMNSMRVPGKNLRHLGDVSLIEHKIRQLKATSAIDRIVVGSDAQEILHLAEKCGAIGLLRESYFCDETRCPANDMIHDLASRVDGDIILWAHCTNPLVGPDVYTDSIEQFSKSLDRGYDSLASVTRIQSHLWDDVQNPINFRPLQHPHQLASELSPIFCQNGAIFIQAREQMVRLRYFYGRKPYLFEMDEFVSLDINSERDLEIAQKLLA